MNIQIHSQVSSAGKSCLEMLLALSGPSCLVHNVDAEIMATRRVKPAALKPLQSALVVDIELQSDCRVDARGSLVLSENQVTSRCISSETEFVHCETQFQKMFSVFCSQPEARAISGPFCFLSFFDKKFCYTTPYSRTA